MVPRFRQVSDGGLHLQGEQHKQRGDLALTDLEGHTSTRTHCACMQNDFQRTAQLSKEKPHKKQLPVSHSTEHPWPPSWTRATGSHRISRGRATCSISSVRGSSVNLSFTRPHDQIRRPRLCLSEPRAPVHTRLVCCPGNAKYELDVKKTHILYVLT